MAKPIDNKKKEKIERKNLFVLILILIIVIGLNVYFLLNYKVIEIREIYSSVIVSDKIGFDLNSTAITFGGVMPGGSSTRTLILENPYKFKIFIYACGEGEISRFINPVKEIIDAGEIKRIGISVNIPKNASFGKYEGKIVLRIKRV